MFREYPSQMPWVIVRLRSQSFALASHAVREMVVADDIVRVADAPPFMRGMVNLRGKVIPVIDLRLRLGLLSAAEETGAFLNLLDAREREHLQWLAELEASVKERRPFALTTDPHQCAFGRWYDAFKTDDAWIALLLPRFQAPHERVHRLGGLVESLKAAGRHDEASAAVAEARAGDLTALRRLFASLRELVRQNLRETLVILNQDDRTVAVTVDAAVAVERLASIEHLPEGTGLRADGLVLRSGRLSGGTQPVLVLECDRLIAAAGPVRAPRSSAPRQALTAPLPPA